MVRDICETAKANIRIKSSDTPYGRDFSAHAWIFDDENMIELLHLAYMQGFNDASGAVMSHAKMLEAQRLQP